VSRVWALEGPETLDFWLVNDFFQVAFCYTPVQEQTVPAVLRQDLFHSIGSWIASTITRGVAVGATGFRFGVFELHAGRGQLFKHGVHIKLQIKPLQILEILVAKPGELVTREELCRKLWPTGTFVDFESGLNTATNRLRGALGDSAGAPR